MKKLHVTVIAALLLLYLVPASPAATYGTGRLDINVKRKTSRARVGWNSKLETVEFSIGIKNNNLGIAQENLQVVFLAIARDCSSKKRYRVMRKKKFKCSIKGGKTFKYDDIEPITLEYDKSWYDYGYKFYAHVVIVRDAAGKLLNAESSQSKWFKCIDRLEKIKVEKELFTDKGRVIRSLRYR